MKVFDGGKTRMIGLPYGEKNYDNMSNRFHLIPERYGQIDGRTDRQTDIIAISISSVSVPTRDENTGRQKSHKSVIFPLFGGSPYWTDSTQKMRCGWCP